jgi:hypothetical protein
MTVYCYVKDVGQCDTLFYIRNCTSVEEYINVNML